MTWSARIIDYHKDATQGAMPLLRFELEFRDSDTPGEPPLLDVISKRNIDQAEDYCRTKCAQLDALDEHAADLAAALPAEDVRRERPTPITEVVATVRQRQRDRAPAPVDEPAPPADEPAPGGAR